MKKIVLINLLFAVVFHASAQDSSEAKNMLKLNITALAFKNVSVQYERAVGARTSVALNARLMPKGSVPFKSLIKSVIDEQETEDQPENAKVGNFAFMPEFRFYVGKKGVFSGFYIAPFVSFARYTAELNYLYDDNGSQKSIPLSGGVTTFTGGLMFGAQWKLSNKVYLDWMILGPNYGTSDGEITGQKTLTASEQSSLRQELDDLELPLTKTTYTVDGNGATVNFKGPWAGVRSGISIGFRF
jgi:hypothetical protein